MKHFWIIGLLFLAMGCGHDEYPLPANQINRYNEYETSLSVISSDELQIDLLESDPFQIISATPYANGFSLLVEYGGGCADHDFTIFWDQLIAESYPPQVTFIMTHQDYDDPCDAIVRDSLFVPYAQLIEDVDIFDPMIVHINNFSNDEQVTFDSWAHQFSEAGCEVPVIARAAACAEGPLGEFLFETGEKLEFNNLRVWLDPVDLNGELSALALTNGQSYTAKVKPVFNSEWWWDGTDCPSGVDSVGSVYPVEIICIQ